MANSVTFPSPVLDWDLLLSFSGSGPWNWGKWLDTGTQLRSPRVAFLVFLPFSPHCPKVSLPNRSIFFCGFAKMTMVFGELLPACEVIVHNLTGSKS